MRKAKPRPQNWLKACLLLPTTLPGFFALSGCAGSALRSDQGYEAATAPNAWDVAPAQVFGGATKNGAPSAGPRATTSVSDPKGAPRKLEEDGFRANSDYHFAMAQAYVAEGATDRAIEEYRLALSYDPGSALLHARLATEFLKKGLLTEAAEECKQALRLDPKFTDARMILAGIHAATQQPELALREYEKVLQFEPGNEEAVVYRAHALLEVGKDSQAIELLKKFTQKNPEAALAFYSLGRAYHRGTLQGESRPGTPKANSPDPSLRQAEAAFRKAMELRPGFTQAALALGGLFEERARPQDAVRIYQELYDSSQEPAAAARLAAIYLSSEKYEQAVPFLEFLQAADPDDLNSRVKLGLVYMHTGKHEKASETFQALLARAPDSDRVRYYLGNLLEETGRPEAALEHFAAVPSSSRHFADAVLHSASIFKKLGKLEQARGHLTRAIEKSPRQPSLYLYLASLEEEARDLPAAIRVLSEASQKTPDDERVHYYLGSLLDRQGQKDLALESMERILVLNPDHADALNYLGYTWTERGVRLDDAERMLQKAVALKPTNGYILDSWGWLLFVRGKIADSVVALEKAVSLTPNEPTILEHLGDAYSRQNLREKALQRYQEALAFASSEDDRTKLQRKLEVMREELARAGRVLPGREGTSTETSRRPASRR